MKQIPIERREEAIPEGYVKVVRCKDCIHCSKEDCWTENGKVTLNNCWNDQGIFTYVLDNDYCSRGYRRDNNG